MSVVAYEGPAGSGKTHALMDHLQKELASYTLEKHQKVLALTFMHGSRRRLDARLKEIQPLKSQFEAITIDSFAWHICFRWRALVSEGGHSIPDQGDYDGTCRLAAKLLAVDYVRTWVSTSFPIIIVDEAQDLSLERAAIVAELSKTAALVLLAYDEFQCLDEARLPIALLSWLPTVCSPLQLTTIHRTNVPELLTAARAVRAGRPLPTGGSAFKITATPSRGERQSYAAACLAGIITTRVRGQNMAVLTPTKNGFANNVIHLIQTERVGKLKRGPFPAIRWETGEHEELSALIHATTIPAICTAKEAVAILAALGSHSAPRAAIEWIERQQRVRGVNDFGREQIIAQMSRSLATQRRYGHRSNVQYAAMTIHQAKNREFDHVVVLWPYAVVDNDEQRRRLLYNAITRARFSCSVLVQGTSLLRAPPFAPSPAPGANSASVPGAVKSTSTTSGGA